MEKNAGSPMPIVSPAEMKSTGRRIGDALIDGQKISDKPVREKIK